MGGSKILRLGIILTLFTAMLVGSILITTGCEDKGPDNPHDVVIQLFGAMERNERAALPYLLDLRELMEPKDEDYALQRRIPRKFFSPEEILNDLTDSGLTKTRWFSMQRVIGDTQVIGDSAWVEVSFVDKDKGIQYYNKFGLHRKKDRWKIYSFRTISR